MRKSTLTTTGLVSAEPIGEIIMAEFKVGDVVKLKSGGPEMTVSETEDEGFVGRP